MISDAKRQTVFVSLVYFAVGAVIAASCTYWLMVYIFKPTDADYIAVTTSRYFEEMSERGLHSVALYKDCQVAAPSEADRSSHVSAIGECYTEDSANKYYYFAAISETGRYLYSDFKKVEK